MFSGMAVSGVIKENIGFYGNFILGMFFALVSMFYAIFFLKVSEMCKSIYNCFYCAGLQNNETSRGAEADRDDGETKWRGSSKNTGER